MMRLDVGALAVSVLCISAARPDAAWFDDKTEPSKAEARQPWQNDFELFAKELDMVGARAVKNLSKTIAGRPITWKLKFVEFRDRADKKANLEFDLTAYGIVEPKRANGLTDQAWKRPVIMAFEPAVAALPDWKKLEAGTVVAEQGTFKKAFWVLLNDTRDFAIVEIAEVTFGQVPSGSKEDKGGLTSKDPEKKDAPSDDVKFAKAPKKLDEIVGDWGRADFGALKGVRLEIKADGTCWTSYVLFMGGRFESTATMSKLKDPPFRVTIAKQPWEIKLSEDGAKLILVGAAKSTLVLPKVKDKKKLEKGKDQP